MNNLDGKENCQAFVEMLGLAVIFPLFMKPVNIKKKKKKKTFNNEGNFKKSASASEFIVLIMLNLYLRVHYGVRSREIRKVNQK